MNLKKVVNGIELKEKMSTAINLLCDTVKSTLGPKGNNIIIDHSAFSPFITNDGVTIAENIESADPVINTILELAKEASIKTNTTVGDGTTTTLVLLQSIFNEGLKEINQGLNPIILKKRLEEDLKIIKQKILSLSKNPTLRDLEKIATTSSNSKEIGKIISKAYSKVQKKNAIRIKEGEDAKTEVVYHRGYIFDTLLASPYFLDDKSIIEIEQPYLLIVNNYLQDVEEIAIYLNEALETNKTLVIIAEDYSDNITNDILAINQEKSTKIYLLKTPEFGKNKQDLLKDLELISQGRIIENINNSNLSNLGLLDSLKITLAETIVYFEQTDRIKKKIAELQNLLSNSKPVDADFLAKRIAMYENGIIDIFVGAITKTERRELKMRYDDALCAIDSAKTGILPGSGLALYKVSAELNSKELSENILKKALKEPFNQIMTNSGLPATEIISKINTSKCQKVYNILTEKYESLEDTTVLDATSVIINALENATSIASMLLTTSSLVINEYQNNLHKVSDFSEI